MLKKFTSETDKNILRKKVHIILSFTLFYWWKDAMIDFVVPAKDNAKDKSRFLFIVFQLSYPDWLRKPYQIV